MRTWTGGELPIGVRFLRVVSSLCHTSIHTDGSKTQFQKSESAYPIFAALAAIQTRQIDFARVTRAVCDCVYGSVPRAVASVAQHQARSLPLAVLTRRVIPYTQSQTALTG